MRVDIDAGYMLLAQRITEGTAGAGTGAPAALGASGTGAGGAPPPASSWVPLTALGRSLAVVRDPAELSKK
jgi:hypothetical protein